MVVGLGLRAVWAAYAARSTPEFLLSGDQYSYWVLGQEIGAGRGYQIPPFTTPTSYYPVGWPAILGLITAVTTHTPLPDSSVLWTALWQIATGTASYALVHRVADRTWGARVAVVAAWLVALWPNLVMSVATYSIETTFVALVLLAVAVLVDHDWTAGAPSTRQLVFGVVLAVAVLVRPFALPIVVGLVLASGAAVSAHGSRSVRRVIPVAVVAMSMVPWTVRNLDTLDAFVPVSTNLGDTLCIDRTLATQTARSSSARGVCRPGAARGRAQPGEHPQGDPFRARPPREGGRAVGDAHLPDDDRRPGHAREVEELGAGRFLPDGLRSTLGVAADAWFFAVGTLALLGAARSRRAMWATPPTHVITFVTAVSLLAIPVLLWGAPRFHVPLSPFLAIGATVAIEGMVDGRRAGRRR